MMKLFSILTLLAILSQEISASVEENEQSSNILVRKKRVLHSTTRLQITPHHAVSIFKDGELLCGGVVLSRDIVLTAAHCIQHGSGSYTVLSDSKKISNSVMHTIRHAKKHPLFNPTTLAHNLALLIVLPTISFRGRGFNQKISFYNGPIATGTVVVLSGWGSTTLASAPQFHAPQTSYPDIVQSIDVQIMTWQDCAARYGDQHTHITSYEICTHDFPAQRKRSGYGDAGGGLTVNGQLAGILSWSRVIVNRYTPDVYTNVGLPIYRQWIHNETGIRV